MQRLTVVLVRNGLISFGLGLLIFSLISRDDEGPKTQDRSGNADILKELEEPFPPRYLRRSGYADDTPPVRTFVPPKTELAEPAALAGYVPPTKPAAPNEYTDRAPIAARDEYPRKQLPGQQKRVPEQLPEWVREVSPKQLPERTRDVSPRQLPQPAREVASKQQPERPREAAPEPVYSERPQPPLIRSAAFGTYPEPGSSDDGRALEPPPLPEHPPHHFVRDGSPSALEAQTRPQAAAQQEKAKPPLSGAFTFLADLLQADSAAMPRASAAPAPTVTGLRRKSAVAPWEPASCDKGHRFWER